MSISILLPYKENFTEKKAGAVSLFVNDITKASILKKKIKIYGNTNYSKFLSSNYYNIKFNKKFYQSANKMYVDNFINFDKVLKSELIEVHNRPKYINQIRTKYSNKLFIYFHNDPLGMSGSITVKERINLLNKTDKILFNSQWCRDRFFVNIDNKEIYLKKIDVIYQSTSKTKINFKKKQKLISFVGKLNSAKGYDVFGKTIIKILDKNPSWRANVYGDEPREKLIFKHKNLIQLGFVSNKLILKDLKKISISVVCSKWDEPFGRTSLEAASRGSALIISNKGGLPETAKDAIILKDVTEKNLFTEIDKLIKNKKKLLSLQKKNFLNFKYTHKFISNKIDDIRFTFLNNTVNRFNVNKNIPLKIIHLTNFNRRFNGRLHYNTSNRFNNGFIRLGHNVLTLSDRDIIHENKKITDLNGENSLQKKIIENVENFKADCIVLGHADRVSKKTLEIIKEKNKNLKICQWFLDPVGKSGPDYIKNNNRIMQKTDFIDATFLTSCPSVLRTKINNSYFIPNPSDPSFEVLKNYKNDCKHDVFFAMSHGVHRGKLKKGKFDKRENFIKKIVKANKNINFDIYGMNNIQPVWGNDFLRAISKSKMALNLSRGNPVKYYSSDRIAQLMGNGLLTFVDDRTCLSDFFSNKEIIFYKNINDLSYKLNKYKKDTKDANRIAKNGRNFYMKYFNSTIVCEFMLSKLFNRKPKNKFIWTN